MFNRNLVIVLVILCCVGTGFAQQTLYQFQPLGVFSGGVNSEAKSINDLSVIVGSSETAGYDKPFVWQSGSMGTLPAPYNTWYTSSDTEASAINNAGNIGINTFEYNGGSVLYPDPRPGYSMSLNVSRGQGLPTLTDINNSRHMLAYDDEAGYFITDMGEAATYRWIITELSGSTASYGTRSMDRANGINDLGQSVGSGWVDIWNDDERVYLKRHVWMYSAGTMTDLGNLGYQTGDAHDINNSGVVVGESCVSEDVDHAFRWTAGGGMSDMGTLGGDYSYAYAVNDAGISVGTSDTASAGEHAFAHIPNIGMVDLNLVMPDDSDWTLTSAVDINQHGHIIGQAWNDDDDVEQGYVLKPTVELTGDIQAIINFDPNGFDPATFSYDGLPDNFQVLGHTVQIDAMVLNDEFTTFKVHYTEDLLATIGIVEDDLRLFWYDDVNDQWILAGAGSNNAFGGDFVDGAPTGNVGDWGVDVDGNYVWANIDHASTYSVFGVPEPATLTILAFGGFALLRKRR